MAFQWRNTPGRSSVCVLQVTEAYPAQWLATALPAPAGSFVENEKPQALGCWMKTQEPLGFSPFIPEQTQAESRCDLLEQ